MAHTPQSHQDAETGPDPRDHIASTQRQHKSLAMTTLDRIKRYVDDDIDAKQPHLEHAEQILAAAVVYLKEATKAAKDDECAARHAACAEVAPPRFLPPVESPAA